MQKSGGDWPSLQPFRPSSTVSGAVASAPAQGRPSVAAPLGTSWRPLFEGPRPPTRLRASAATAVRARARADRELVTHLRIGASGRCARKPWTNAASSRVPALELGLAGWLPRLLGTVLCELPLGECGACACYEALCHSGGESSFEWDARPLRRASAVHLSRTCFRNRSLVAEAQGLWRSRRFAITACSDVRPALSRISSRIEKEYHLVLISSEIRLHSSLRQEAKESALLASRSPLSLHHCKLLASVASSSDSSRGCDRSDGGRGP